ncbi:MAG TPA: GNAT family N-acetyltransferase [Caulobacteraceae bacterium]|nr:GNAT family N-acetyltransferase [Caulobacteraceae bacterium]
MAAMEIIDFQPKFAGAFKTLNEAWIEKHYLLEPKDTEILGDPEGAIVGNGGFVFFAVEDGEAIGCVAMIAMADGGFEIVKMAVDETRRGHGAGRALMAACVERGRTIGAPRLYLESGLALEPALALYRRFGFVDLEPERRPPSPYARVEVWMELRL